MQSNKGSSDCRQASFDIKSFFRQVIEKNRMATCYLFVGDNALKKIEVARYLAKALNCPGALKDEDCLCDSCMKIENFNHPDVVWIKPALGEKLKIDRIRAVIRKLYLKPYMSEWKIFIIEEADSLTEEAQNAFLKTLEEPPLDSVIILMVQQKEVLLKTIISRCQVVKFLSAIQKQETESFIKDFLLSGDKLEFSEILAKKIDKSEMSKILDSLLICFRDALVCKAGEENLMFNSPDMSNIKEIGRRYSYQKLENIIKEIIHLKNLIGRNVNPKIAMSVLCLALEEGR